MEFKIKNLPISTGDALVAIINTQDATKYDLHRNDRIRITNGNLKQVTAVIDFADSKNFIPSGQIGLFEEVAKTIGAKKDHMVKVEVERKPESVNSIKRKLNGEKLGYEDFKRIITDIASQRLTAIEMTYFVSACYTHELSTKETFYLTKAMIDTGEVLRFHDKIIMDKHCIGGVAANRTTAVVVAIIAAAGYTIPKTSSRSITSAAGTADTIEYLCNVNMSAEKLKEVVHKTKGCLAWGGALNLAPADDKIIRVESPISLDPTGQLIASVLAKKKSVSANHVLIDIPVGKGAKIENIKEARKLKKKFQKISRMLGMKTRVVVTDGSHPIGNGIGPALEARDILWTLKNDMKGSWELKEKSIRLAGTMLNMAGHWRGEKLARKIFDDGSAYKKFIEIVTAQGGKEIDPDMIRLGKYTHDVYAHKAGVVTHIDNKAVNRVARIAGAPVDKLAGVYIYAHIGKTVRVGEKLYTIYSDNKERLKFAKENSDKDLGIIIQHHG